MQFEEKLDHLVITGAALCAAMATMGNVNAEGVCDFRLASRFLGVTPQFPLNSITVTLHNGNIDIGPTFEGPVMTETDGINSQQRTTLRVSADRDVPTTDFNKNSAVFKFCKQYGISEDEILDDATFEWVLDRLFQGSEVLESQVSPDQDDADPKFTTTWSISTDPLTDAAADRILHLQICCITEDCAISQIQSRITIPAAVANRQPAMFARLAEVLSGQLVVSLTGRRKIRPSRINFQLQDRELRVAAYA